MGSIIFVKVFKSKRNIQAFIIEGPKLDGPYYFSRDEKCLVILESGQNEFLFLQHNKKLKKQTNNNNKSGAIVT